MSGLRLITVSLLAACLSMQSCGTVGRCDESKAHPYPPSPPPCDVRVRLVDPRQERNQRGLVVVAIGAGMKVAPDRSLVRLHSGFAFLIDLAHPPESLHLDPCSPERTWTVWMPGRGRWSGTVTQEEVLSLPLPDRPGDPMQLIYEAAEGAEHPLLREVVRREDRTVTFALPEGWIGGTENELVRRLLHGSVDDGVTYVPIGPWDPKSTYKRPVRETISLEVGPWRAASLYALRQDPDDPDFVEHRQLVGYRLEGTPLVGEFIWTRQRLRKYANPEDLALVPSIGSMFTKYITIVDTRQQGR
jgi:hypothetical protein